MANISDATGRMIRMSMDSSETKADLVKTWNIIRSFWEAGEYGATFDEISEEDITGNGSEIYAETSFAGWGRWTFANNVESFGEWIEESSTITPEEKEFLAGKDFSIRYDFCDYEMGCEVFYEAEMENVHRAGTPLSATETETISEEDIEISAENIKKYIGYADEEVADMNMPREELKQWFIHNDSAPREQIEAVFDNDAAYEQLKEDEAGSIFWSYDNGISWEDYVPAHDEKMEKITIRKVDSPDRTNEGLVYGAFNSYGTPVGKRFRTAEECRKSFEEKGYSSFVMPKNEKGKER